MAKHKKALTRYKTGEDYLPTTKLFCGYCEVYFCGESGTSRTGIVHYYKYVSVKKKRTERRKKSVRK